MKELVTIAPEVIQQIEQMLQEAKVKSRTVRIVANGDPGGSYVLALDWAMSTDRVEEHGTLQFIVSDELYAEFKGFTIISIEVDGEVFLQIRHYKAANDCGSSGCSSCSSCG